MTIAAVCWLGRLLFEDKRTMESIPYAKHAAEFLLQQHPDLPPVSDQFLELTADLLFWLGIRLVDEKNTVDALQVLPSAVALLDLVAKPNDIRRGELFNALAFTCIRRKQWADAELDAVQHRILPDDRTP